jgi:hypothetical protein
MMGNIVNIIPSPTSENTSTGVTPGFVFSKDGNTGVGTYLRIGSVVTSDAGHPIIGKNILVRMRATVKNTIGTDTVIQLQERTAVNTRTDIAGAAITIPAGQYKASVTLDVPLPEDVELCAYNKSGATLSNVVVNVFLFPDYT